MNTLNNTMKMTRSALILAIVLAVAAPAFAGFTDTLPQGAFMLDSAYMYNKTRYRYNEHSQLANIVDDFEMYEPTGLLQGKMKAPAYNVQQVVLTTFMIGITDNWTAGFVCPYLVKQETWLNLGWESGDYSSSLGRPYSEQDFWQWAGSMGQPKPQDWKNEKGTMGDLIIATRYRFYNKEPWSLGFFAFYDTGTGKDTPPEILGAVGTTGYVFGSNGDVGLHVSADRKLKGMLDDRFTVGGEAYYEYYFERTLETPKGTVNPLLLRQSPYVGDTYKVKPGDFLGVVGGIDITLIKGPEEPTWMTKDNPAMQAMLPAMLTLSTTLNHCRLFNHNYSSNSEVWDMQQEEGTQAGFRNTVNTRLTFSFFRLGAPVNIYYAHNNQELIPGKNFRPVVGNYVGMSLLAKF